MTFQEAIAAAEQAATDLSAADGAQAAAQTKYEATLAAKNAADQADVDAVKVYNAAIDTLIAAATASKR